MGQISCRIKEWRWLGHLAAAPGVNERHKRAGKNQNHGSDTDGAPVSHAPPCETVASRGQGAALYKRLPAACGPAGAPHMFVLWSSHTDADGFAGPRCPSWSRPCPFVASAWLPSTTSDSSNSSFLLLYGRPGVEGGRG